MESCQYGFIYITTNLINGKKYIGQRKYDKDRDNYLGSGIHLKNAIKKYGRENFTREIIAEASSIEELNRLEIYYINLYNAVNSPNYYNIASGGKCANNFAGKSDEEMVEICKKLSQTKIGEHHPLYGKHHSEESRKKMSENHADFSKEKHPLWGKKHSTESRKKMSENHVYISGEAHCQYIPRTPEMYYDIKNGMRRKDFLLKYNVSRKIWDSIRKEIENT